MNKEPDAIVTIQITQDLIDLMQFALENYKNNITDENKTTKSFHNYYISQEDKDILVVFDADYIQNNKEEK